MSMLTSPEPHQHDVLSNFSDFGHVVKNGITILFCISLNTSEACYLSSHVLCQFGDKIFSDLLSRNCFYKLGRLGFCLEVEHVFI